jgi:hypothetical protein
MDNRLKEEFDKQLLLRYDICERIGIDSLLY